MQAKRAQILEQMRGERNVAPAPTKPETPKEAEDGKSVSKPVDRDNGGDPGNSPDNSSDPEAIRRVEIAKREKAVAAAEQSLRDARTAAEREKAAAATQKAQAEKALAELAAAKDSPAEFLAKVGMTKEEWIQFFQDGGKPTPAMLRQKATEKRLEELEKAQAESERRQAEHARKASTDLENAQFEQTLGSYVFLSKLGGTQAVRNKQLQIQRAEGRLPSMKEAADLVETEIKTSLGPLLKHADVRASLNLDNRDQPASDNKPQSKTLNGSEGAKSPQAADEEEHPHALDWAAKKRKVAKLLEADRLRREGRGQAARA